MIIIIIINDYDIHHEEVIERISVESANWNKEVTGSKKSQDFFFDNK